MEKGAHKGMNHSTRGSCSLTSNEEPAPCLGLLPPRKKQKAPQLLLALCNAPGGLRASFGCTLPRPPHRSGAGGALTGMVCCTSCLEPHVTSIWKECYHTSAQVLQPPCKLLLLGPVIYLRHYLVTLQSSSQSYRTPTSCART